MRWCDRVTVWLRTCVGSDVSDAFDVLDEPDHEVRITMWHSIAWDHHTVTLDVMEQLLVRLLDRGLWIPLGWFAFAPLAGRVKVRYPCSTNTMRDSHLAVTLFFSTELAMRVIVQLDHTDWVWLTLDLFRYTPLEKREHVQPVLCHLLEWWKASDRAIWDDVSGLHTITLDMVAMWPVDVAQSWLHQHTHVNRMLFFMPDTPAAHWLLDRLVYLRSEQANLLAACRHQYNRPYLCSDDLPVSTWMFRRILDQIPNWFFQSKMADWMVCSKHATCFYALAQRERQLIHMLYQRRLSPYAQVVHRILTRKVHSRDIVTHIMRFMCSSTSLDRDSKFTRLCMAHGAHAAAHTALAIE